MTSPVPPGEAGSTLVAGLRATVNAVLDGLLTSKATVAPANVGSSYLNVREKD